MLDDFHYSAQQNFQDQLTILRNQYETALTWEKVKRTELENQVRNLLAQRDGKLNEQNEFIENSQETIHDLVKRNIQLQEAMAKQQKLMEEWIVSQKAFKALAYKYGNSKNLKDEQIKEDLVVAKQAVIDGVKTDDIVLKNV